MRNSPHITAPETTSSSVSEQDTASDFRLISLHHFIRQTLQKQGPIQPPALPYAQVLKKLGTIASCFRFLPNDSNLSPKALLRQELLNSLVNCAETDSSLIMEIEQFFCSKTDEFFNHRSISHIGRVIRLLAALRKNVSASSPAHITLRLFRSTLGCHNRKRKILCIAFSIQVVSQDLAFDERLVRECVQRLMPNIGLVPYSFYSAPAGKEPARIAYVEIEKKDSSEFTHDEIPTLHASLTREIESCIETMIPTVELPQNEEESLRTILLLSQQIKKLKDIPQVMIQYRGQSAYTIDFCVTLVHLVEKDRESRFFLTKLPNIVRMIPTKKAIVGCLRQKLQKEAISFIVQCLKEPFLRHNRSIDFLKARETVILSLKSTLGVVRDVNGGLFYQQTHLINELIPALSSDEKKELHIVENLFHSLTPCITKNMVSKMHMLTLFRLFFELRTNRKDPKKRFIAEKHSQAAFVGFICPNGAVPEELLLLKSHLQVSDHSIASTQTRFFDRLYGFAVCFTDDDAVQNRFIEYARGMIEGKKRSCSRNIKLGVHLKSAAFDPSIAGDHTAGSIIQFMYEGLTRASSDTTCSFAIAEKVQISDDARTLTFSLRKTYWSDGTPVTANDFASGWKRALQPLCKNPYAYLLYPIKNARFIKHGKEAADALGVQIHDEMSFSVELEYSYPEFLLLCSHWIYSPIPSYIDEKQAQWEESCDKVLRSNGPFMIKKQSVPSNLTLVKNPYYWDASHVVPESILLSMNLNADTSRIEFEQEEIDWLGEPFTELSHRRLKQGRRMCTLSSSSVYGIALNVQKIPFRSSKIRAALSLALDRSLLCAAGERASHSLLALSHTLLNCSQSLPFNKVQAQALFQQGINEQRLRHSDLATLNCLVVDLPKNKRRVEDVLSVWKEDFGLSFHCTAIPQANLIEACRTINYDLVFSDWQSTDKGSFLLFQTFKEAEDPHNLSRWSYEPFSKLIMKAEQTLSSGDRQNHLQEAEAMLIEQMPIIPLIDRSFDFLACPSFPKFILSPFGTFHILRSNQ
jgi:ABC-type oligopeptide transport system substrate-binding subunit